MVDLLVPRKKFPCGKAAMPPEFFFPCLRSCGGGSGWYYYACRPVVIQNDCYSTIYDLPWVNVKKWYSSSSMHILYSLALNATGARYVTMFSNRFNHWHFHSVSSRNVTTSTQSRLQFTTQYVCNRNQLKQPSGTKEKWGERLKMMNLMPWIQKLTWLQALAHLPDAAESSDTNVAPDLTDFQQICMSYLI